MGFDDTPFVLLDDARAGGADGNEPSPARLYQNARSVICANDTDMLAQAWDQMRDAHQAGLHLAGYISYEAGLALEQRLSHLVPEERPGPLLWFGVFDGYDRIAAAQVADHLPDPHGAYLGPLVPNISRSAYDAAFTRVKDYIAAGDIYQANLTFRTEARMAGHPMALYAALRGRAQAGYGGAIWDGNNWSLSFSPELFFALKSGRITAKPMKGTAARVPDGKADQQVQQDLAQDSKQRAENLMIVDLLRNDLSRICESGSVEVPALFAVESYPTIHQMTSTVTARLRSEVDSITALQNIFPCGSITGAPKIRAMEIIDELEPDPRGLYCGSMGRIDPNGDAAFNVAIRSFTQRAGEEKLSIGLGSGIVSDSNGYKEWQECLAKGEFARNMGSVSGRADFDLIETMGFAPESGICRLEGHLERMKNSALALGFEFDRHAARNTLHAAVFHQNTHAKVRLLLSRSGAISIEVGLMEPPAGPCEDGTISCTIVPMSAQPQDFRLHHKTTDRSVYAVAEEIELADTEPVFVDAQGFVTEAAIYNIFVPDEADGDILLTPPSSRGLLPGVLRTELLATGKAQEADLHPEDLHNGFLLGNSVRGLRPAVLR